MSIVKLELTPYNALTILSFLQEFTNEPRIREDYKMRALVEAAEELNKTIAKNITPDQIIEADQENQINQIIGKSPTR